MSDSAIGEGGIGVTPPMPDQVGADARRAARDVRAEDVASWGTCEKQFEAVVTAAAEVAYAAGRADERARVVAWLQRPAPFPHGIYVAGLVDSIGRGEHLDD
jgi:hypothetical protein